MRKFVFLCASLGVLGWGPSAFAAEQPIIMSGLSGKVLINQGEGFVTAANGLALRAGDKVLLGLEGTATLAMAKGKKQCEMDLPSGAVTVVDPNQICAPKADGAVITPTAAQVVSPLPGYLVAATYFVVGTTTFTYSQLQDDEPASGE
jgi:hypothetical protein